MNRVKKNNFWTLHKTNLGSEAWCCLLRIKDKLINQFFFKVKDGEGISFFLDPWVPGLVIGTSLQLDLRQLLGAEGMRVSLFFKGRGLGLARSTCLQSRSAMAVDQGCEDRSKFGT